MLRFVGASELFPLVCEDRKLQEKSDEEGVGITKQPKPACSP